MIVLSAKNLTKLYGVEMVLQDITFHVNEGDKIGIVGANGAGKTTLLKILTGELDYDSGEFYLQQGKSVGYLKQKDDFDVNNTIINEVRKIFAPLKDLENEIEKVSNEITELTSTESSEGKNDDKVSKCIDVLEKLQAKYETQGGYTYKSEIVGILASMGFDENCFDKEIRLLSGGERTRLSLACLLLQKPDILFLDEPTNHLDIGTLKWLEQYIKAYKGTVLIVSHDRYFLDQTVNKIFQVENHCLNVYNGNYQYYLNERKKRYEEQLKAYTKQHEEIDRQEEMIRRFKQRGTEKLAKRAASREKQIEKVEVIEKPKQFQYKMKLKFKEEFKSGTDVLHVEDLSKTFQSLEGEASKTDKGRTIFRNVNFDIKRGEKICIVGQNGVGKTTLLKILMEEMPFTNGNVKIGHNVVFGYYDQGQMLLNESNTVLEELKEAYRFYTDTEMRSILGGFLFQNDDVFNSVGSLSGGEKARLALLKLMLSGANTLLLDEPTNHLDIDSKEVFEEALSQFPGTALIVSHDRYLLNKIPDRIFEICSDGITEYLGKYDYYVNKKEAISSGKQYISHINDVRENLDEVGETDVKRVFSEKKLSAAEERQLNKEKEARERKRKREKEKLEAEILFLEDKIKDLENELCKEENLDDYELLGSLSKELEMIKSKLDVFYEKWIEL